jgi:hypothetical protein
MGDKPELRCRKRLSATPVPSGTQTLLNLLGGVTLITPFRFVSQEQKFYSYREFQEHNK